MIPWEQLFKFRKKSLILVFTLFIYFYFALILSVTVAVARIQVQHMEASMGETMVEWRPKKPFCVFHFQLDPPFIDTESGGSLPPKKKEEKRRSVSRFDAEVMSRERPRRGTLPPAQEVPI